MSRPSSSRDPQANDTRRFRLVLAVTFAVYAAAAVALTVLQAPPSPELEEVERQRVARLLIDAEDLARQQAEAAARKKAEEEARRKREEAEARRKAEEEARKKAEEEVRKKREAEERKKAEEAERRKREEEARKRLEEEQRLKELDEQTRKAEEERRKSELARKAEEERQRKLEEDRRRKEEEEAARIRRQEEARESEEARRQLQLLMVLREKRRQELEAKRAEQEALGSGLLGGLGDEEDDFGDFLAGEDAPLVGGGEGGLLGAAPVPSAAAPEGGTAGGSAEIDQLLADIGEMEGLETVLGDIGVDAASEEELTAFLDEVAAGRVDLSEMVARNITRMESPFTIVREAGGFGVRKEEDIRKVILSHYGENRVFYEQAMRHIPGLRGTVVIRMVINAAGRVIETAVVTSDTGAPAFDRELADRIKEWVFPPVPQGEVEGTYPFRFGDGL